MLRTSGVGRGLSGVLSVGGLLGMSRMRVHARKIKDVGKGAGVEAACPPSG